MFQRACTAPVTQGLFNNNPQQLSKGIQALEYAFNANSSFKLSTKFTTPQEIASVGAFFYSELGHSLLLAQNSSWFQSNTQTIQLRDRLNLDIIADWMNCKPPFSTSSFAI